ncbi:MAG: valine--tRNA ligase [Planctomycetia bacterium]|nr:valine--tRNA ligase [Planctomycetia bacterium]
MEDPRTQGEASASAGTLAKSYSPAASEPEVREAWSRYGDFHAEPAETGGSVEGAFSVLIPPPNVTAALHLGHAFNNTLQDVLVRYHRMKGDRTLWMPGTDHAGIATQTVVEKRLLRQGKRRTDFSRSAFIEQVQAWKDEYETTILGQLAEMGCSCDFDRTRFTMDPVCTDAVREAFFRLFDDGLVYRGKRLVNWDPATRTALADDEVEMRDVPGHMWYLRYPLADGDGHVTVATTRPETMLGDTAIAINPRDPRAAGLRGRSVRVPITDRIVPIVEDDYVVLPTAVAEELGLGPEAINDPKAALATGFLKVTPAHDPNDWEIGLRHELPVINVMAPDGSISVEHGWSDDVTEEARGFVGLSREEARTAIVAWFEDRGLLESVRDHEHAVGHSYRSHVPIEPYLSDQWYVRVTDDRLAGSALRSMDPEQRGGDASGESADAGPMSGDGGLRFFPDRYAKTFRNWHENIRDWCISRQLWWGHRIPVWSRTRAAEEADASIRELAREAGDAMIATESDWTARGCAHRVRMLGDGSIEETVCVPRPSTLGRDADAVVSALEAEGFEQDPDVLDTWFSSALWPLSTMGWPEPEAHADAIPEGGRLLETFNPSSVLCTAREIITLWVSRMVMFNRYFEAELPFRHVFIHAMIQDGHGQKMSKSLGNGVDPRDIIESHGADAMRFTLAQLSTGSQDVRMPVDMVCPHSGETFTPAFVRNAAGYQVSAPVQKSPKDPALEMVTSYGVATGEVEPDGDRPLARNTSSRFDAGRNFCNKLWNAVRFGLSNLESPAESGGDAAPSLVDRWIVSRVHRTERLVAEAIDGYQFNAYVEAMYDLVWRDFCDWYLEAVKPTVRGDLGQQRRLHAVLDSILRMLHPVCPFLTETLWPNLHRLQGIRGDDGATGVEGLSLPSADRCVVAPWPDIAESAHDSDAEAAFERVQALVSAIRNLRGERQVKPKRRINLHASASVMALIEAAGGVVETLAGLDEVGELESAPDGAIPLPFEGDQLLISNLLDAVDVEGERKRLQKTIDGKRKQIAGFKGKLGNEGYVKNAKPEMVEETRLKLIEAEADLAAAEAGMAALASAPA